MTDKIRSLLKDIQTVYEGKRMVVHPNSFDELRTEVIKLDNINKQQSEQIEKMKCPQNCKNGSVYNWSDNSICMDCEKVRTLHEDNWQKMCKGCKYWEIKEIKEND